MLSTTVGMSKTSNLSPILELAAHQRGVFTTRQAIELGIPEAALRRQLDVGAWRRVRRGVLAVVGAPECWPQQLWIAHLAAGPTSAVSGRAAARALGLPGYRRQAIEVLVPHSESHRTDVERLRRTRFLPAAHTVTRDGLPPLTSVARTIFDLAGDPNLRLTFRVERWREAHKRHIGRLMSRSLRREDFTMIGMMRMLAAFGRRGARRNDDHPGARGRVRAGLRPDRERPRGSLARHDPRRRHGGT